MESCISIPLKYCTYEIWPKSRLVKTVFPDGPYCIGMRDETDPINILEAESEGYTGQDSVWRSMVEHELLHSVICEVLFDSPSRVIRSEAQHKWKTEGNDQTEYWMPYHSARVKYEEEVLVLSFQEWSNGILQHKRLSGGWLTQPFELLLVVADRLKKSLSEVKW